MLGKRRPSIRERISRWWNGTFYENKDPLVLWIGIERHWTSRWAHSIADFLAKEWKWCIGVLLTGIGLWLAYLTL